MATKKITIENPVVSGEEQPILSNLDQAWGGVNTGDSAITPYSDLGCNIPVPAGKEWGLTHAEVERFLKSQLTALKTAKVGSTCFSPSPNSANHYELWGFATAADQQEYLTELAGVTSVDDLPAAVGALRLFMAELPIAATAIDSYTLNLSTSRTGSTQANPLVVGRGADYNVPLRVFAWHYPPSGTGDAANYNTAPTIIVERSSNGVTWDRVGSATVTGIAESESDTTYPNVINVGKMIDTGSDGVVMLRFTIPSYSYTNAVGETATMSSNRVTLYIRTVTLGITMDVNEWISPKHLADSATRLQVAFNLQGAVAKTLHVKFTNTAGSETYDVTLSDVTATGAYNYTIADDAGTMGVTASGVHTLTAWLSYGSGADEIVSPVIVHQLLILKPSTASGVGQRVLLQQMAQTVDNFVQSTLCHYWVWNPVLNNGSYINDTSAQVPVRFIVADGTSLSGEHEEYVVLPVSVTPGTDQELIITMEIETATVQDSYTARLHALNADGNAMISPARQFVIDNTSGFQPVAGCVFQLNPKQRDNTEATPQTIVNASKSAGAVADPASTWSGTFKMDNSDGYTQDDGGEKVLRIPAGRVLTVSYNPLDYLYTAPAPSKSLTIDIDFQVNNIVNEDDPVLQLCEPSGSSGEYLGLRLLPMTGTMGSVSDHDPDTTDFRWAESRRQHLCVTVTPSVYPNVNDDARYLDNYTSQQAHGSINLVRVYLNGVIVRETEYNPNNVSDGKGVEFCTSSALQLIFGQTGTGGRASGADIDIYGMRVWNIGLTPRQVLQNYIAALPGSTEKRRIKAQNDITLDDNSGRISLPKACDAGKNCMIWHGSEVMFGYGAGGSERGWLEIRRYDYDGTYLPQYSGSFCKASKRLKGKGQGTTAMTYFYWNIQWKYGDVAYNDDDQLVPSECLILTPSQLNSTIIHTGTPVLLSSLSSSDQNIFALFDGSVYTHVCPVYGGNLGKDEPVGTGTKYYPCTVDGSGGLVTIALPDGWINGTGDLYDATTNPLGGLYCGPCWQPGPGLPYGSKHVLKINYASSMQSHLIGINWLYDQLHTAYCGPNSLQRDVTSAVVAKQVVPVLFFTAGKSVVSQDETNGTANFRGLGGFGPGKMDKPAWGYSKKASKITDASSPNYRPDGHDYFAMYEGAVNNSVLSDQIAPWDDTDHLDAQGNVIQRAKVKYFLQDPLNPGVAKDPESFYYRHTDSQGNDSWEKGIGFDGGKTGRTSDDGLLANSNSCDSPGDAPSAKITAILRNAWNYVYLHNPNIRFFNGTQEELAAATLTEAQRKRKWVTKDSWLLKRWDFCERAWVDAGLWNTSTHAYDQINIFTTIGSPSDLQDDRQAVIDAYIDHIVSEARPTNEGETDGIGAYFKTKSLRFHYVFENHFIAGTDNCSKNTYYVIDPVTHLIELHQDDVDTTLATDNFGFQSKPYYVDRMNPYDDKDTVRAENSSCYDGMLNTLFDLVEEMWAKRGTDTQKATLGNALGSVLGLMEDLNGGIGSAESETTTGVWRTLNRYLFDIQRYFPQVTYNETARIRYEFPAMLGYVGRDGEAPPLSQSMGDQLEAEIQFMRRRLIYMASYAGYGEFSHTIGGGSGSTGIADAVARLSVNSVALPNGGTPDQTFTVTPHQYLFPVFTWQSQTLATRYRMAPGTSHSFTTSFGFAESYPIALCGLNYYRSVGNLGDKTVNATSFAIQGSRLTEFTAEPTTYYSTTQGGGSITRSAYMALTATEKAAYAPAFARPSNLQIGAGSDGATRLRTLSLNGCTTTGSTPQVPFDLSRLTLAETIDLRNTAMAAVTLPQTSTLTTLHLPASLTSLVLTAQPSLATLDLEGYAALTRLVLTGCPLVDTRLVVADAWTAEAPLAEMRVTGMSWTLVNTAMLMWMVRIATRQLTGSIDTTQGANSVGPLLTLADIMELYTKYGDITTGAGGLTVSYSKQAMTGVGITGPKFITSAPQDVEWGINVAQGNNIAFTDGHPAMSWQFVTRSGDTDTEDTGAATYVTLTDTWSGRGRATRLNTTGDETRRWLKVTVTLIGGATLSTYKRIALFNREPKVGDIAFHDGTFDQYPDSSLKVVGAVIRRDVNGDGTVTLWVYAAGNVSLTSRNGSLNNANQMAWGVYPNDGGSGITASERTQIESDCEMVSGRLTNMPQTDKTQNSGNNVSDNEAVLGVANSVIQRWMSSLWANADISATALPNATTSDLSLLSWAKEKAGQLPVTQAELADMMVALSRYKELNGETSPTRFRQLFYPAVYACHVYEPANMPADTDTQYAAGKWMLPSIALLKMIYGMFHASRSGTNQSPNASYANESTAATDSSTYGSSYPLFANLLKRYADDGLTCPVAMPSNSNYWSATETNTSYAWYVSFGSGNVGSQYKGTTSNVVRPVSAFTYAQGA